MRLHFVLVLLVPLVLVGGLSGCALAPLIGGVSDLGVTEAGRARILSKALRDYHDTLQIGDLNFSRRFASPELAPQLETIYPGVGSTVRVTGYKAITTTFVDASDTAEIRVKLDFYDVSRLMVRSREEKQTWKFHTGGSWELIEIEPTTFF